MMDFFRWMLLAGLVALLVMLPLEAGGSGSPPLLDIASEPLGAGCVIQGSADVTVRGAATVALGDVFQVSYDLSNWAGHFERYALQSGGSGVHGGGLRWDAGLILTGSPSAAPHPLPEGRNIRTAIVDPDGRLQNVPFDWASLSEAQRAALDRLPSARRADGLGAQRLAYLRGDRSHEGELFRRRTSLLGDSVHSNPVYVGAPSRQPFALTRDGSYDVFYRAHQARRNVAYIGANDGMLHAFDAQEGVELFAYVPDALMPVLSGLTSPVAAHRAYVDGPAMAAEAWSGDRWRTVLVSAMGGGAQGVFALDVSDPGHFDGALWEFTDRDDTMMGNVTTPPQIARFQTRPGVIRYFVVVASGLNSGATDGHRSSSGKGALFLLALDKPPDAPWRLNTNYFRIQTPVADTSLANALSAPVLAADGEGVVRYAYAGDLQGNLWRFDFAGRAPWSERTAIFVARDAEGHRQSIAQQPLLVYAEGGGYLILFGTGQLIGRADLAASAAESYYAIVDRLERPPDVVRGRNELAQRVLSGATDAVSLSLGGADITPGSKGWYVDFLDAAHTGERSVNSGMLLGGVLYLNTFLPGRDSCTPARSRSYALEVGTGQAAALQTLAANGQYLNAPYIGHLQEMSAALPYAAPVGEVTAGQFQQRSYDIVQFSAAGAEPMRSEARAQVRSRIGRLSWRQVANWRVLHAAARWERP